VVRATALQLVIERQHGGHLTGVVELQSGVEVDRVERPDLERQQPQGALERRAVDGNRSDAAQHPFGDRLQTLASRQPAQLDDQQTTGPPAPVAGEGRADGRGVGLGEQHSAERRCIEVEPCHQYGRSRSAASSRSVVPAG